MRSSDEVGQTRHEINSLLILTVSRANALKKKDSDHEDDGGGKGVKTNGKGKSPKSRPGKVKGSKVGKKDSKTSPVTAWKGRKKAIPVEATATFTADGGFSINFTSLNFSHLLETMLDE